MQFVHVRPAPRLQLHSIGSWDGMPSLTAAEGPLLIHLSISGAPVLCQEKDGRQGGRSEIQGRQRCMAWQCTAAPARLAAPPGCPAPFFAPTGSHLGVNPLANRTNLSFILMLRYSFVSSSTVT